MDGAGFVFACTAERMALSEVGPSGVGSPGGRGILSGAPTDEASIVLAMRSISNFASVASDFL